MSTSSGSLPGIGGMQYDGAPGGAANSSSSNNSAGPSSISRSTTKELPNHRRVAQLTHRRMATFEYIRRLLGGSGHHMGTIAIPMSTLPHISTNSDTYGSDRAGQLFQLGLSVGKLLQVNDRMDFAKAMDKLLSEFDVYVGEAPAKRQNIFARLRTFGDQQTGGTDPGLLEIVHLPFDLDFIEIMVTLCDLMPSIYTKLTPSKGGDCPDSYLETLLRLDDKSRQESPHRHVIDRVIKEVDVVSTVLLREQLQALLVSDPSNASY
ncbi:hypothetical protein BC831DRAFT_461736 [Entophlyctis helioformis]|nr:hypothetical protein BC831DRAFT_461736 [Entophlyctis helioformis]